MLLPFPNHLKLFFCLNFVVAGFHETACFMEDLATQTCFITLRHATKHLYTISEIYISYLQSVKYLQFNLMLMMILVYVDDDITVDHDMI